MLRTSLALCVLSSLSFAAAPVVGGKPAPRGKWPDVVAVVLEGGMCSGTLIAPDVVLTAAHCIEGHPLEVIVDTVDYSRPGGDRIPIASSRAYPDWEERYDVGVLVLERPAAVPARVVAATCTAHAELVEDKEVRIVGFGLATYQGTDANTKLREATVPIVDPTCTLDPSCEPALAPDGEFMAGGQGADSCFGDSGGPVMLETASGPVLVGVVSRGLALPAAPCGGGGVYVRADRVAAWVKRVTGRTLQRTSCGGKADEVDEVRDGRDGGCSVGGSGGLGVALGLSALLGFRHKRRPPGARYAPRR